MDDVPISVAKNLQMQKSRKLRRRQGTGSAGSGAVPPPVVPEEEDPSMWTFKKKRGMYEEGVRATNEHLVKMREKLQKKTHPVAWTGSELPSMSDRHQPPDLAAVLEGRADTSPPLTRFDVFTRPDGSTQRDLSFVPDSYLPGRATAAPARCLGGHPATHYLGRQRGSGRPRLCCGPPWSHTMFKFTSFVATTPRRQRICWSRCPMGSGKTAVTHTRTVGFGAPATAV